MSKERTIGMTRKSISFPNDMWEEIDSYRHAERIGTEVEALRRLVQEALTRRRSSRYPLPESIDLSAGRMRVGGSAG